MDNPFDEMQSAVESARMTLRAVDRHANSMAKLLEGRLHHVEPWLLRLLKRELQDFNASNGKWKGKRCSKR